jgi:hypothetical protein
MARRELRTPGQYRRLAALYREPTRDMPPEHNEEKRRLADHYDILANLVEKAENEAEAARQQQSQSTS